METPRRVLVRQTCEKKGKPRKILYEHVEAEKVTDIEVDLKAETDKIRTEESYIDEIEQLKLEIESKNQEILELKRKIFDLEKSSTFGINSIKHSDNLIKIHTGLPSYALFCWILDEVRPAASNMQYYKGEQSHETKQYQENNSLKPGPKRKLSLEDEFLLTLMKLKMNLNQDFLVSLFKVCPSLVSSVISTWIPLLAFELKPLIYWPASEELDHYYPECYKKYGKIKAIIDCTEVQTERPSLDSVNAAMYSNYKSRHTYKVLVACTPGGTVSYVSDAVGGDMSDVELVRKSGILDKFEKGDKVMADKGFNNKDDFLVGDVELITPEFARKSVQFTESKNVTNAQVSNAQVFMWNE